MRASISVTAVLAALSLSGCSAPDAGASGSVSLESDDQRGSYAVGYDMGQALTDAKSIVEVDAFMAGFRNGLDGEGQMEEADRQAALREISTRIRYMQMGIDPAQVAANLAAGQAFLEENGTREGVVTTASGMQYEVLEEGTGATPTANDQVRVHYRGTLIDGTEFDSSIGGEPMVAPAGGLITGFTEALLLMKEGARYKVYIPADLAYGDQQRGEFITPNSALIFEIELIEIL